MAAICRPKYGQNYDQRLERMEKSARIVPAGIAADNGSHQAGAPRRQEHINESGVYRQVEARPLTLL